MTPIPRADSLTLAVNHKSVARLRRMINTSTRRERRHPPLRVDDLGRYPGRRPSKASRIVRTTSPLSAVVALFLVEEPELISGRLQLS